MTTLKILDEEREILRQAARNQFRGEMSLEEVLTLITVAHRNAVDAKVKTSTTYNGANSYQTVAISFPFGKTAGWDSFLGQVSAAVFGDTVLGFIVDNDAGPSDAVRLEKLRAEQAQEAALPDENPKDTINP